MTVPNPKEMNFHRFAHDIHALATWITIPENADRGIAEVIVKVCDVFLADPENDVLRRRSDYRWEKVESARYLAKMMLETPVEGSK